MSPKRVRAAGSSLGFLMSCQEDVFCSAMSVITSMDWVSGARISSTRDDATQWYAKENDSSHKRDWKEV